MINNIKKWGYAIVICFMIGVTIGQWINLVQDTCDRIDSIEMDNGTLVIDMRQEGTYVIEW